MNPILKQLIALQELDNEILSLAKYLNEMPLQIETSKIQLENERKILEVAGKEIEELKKERLKLEQQALLESDHMAKVKVKQTSVKTNEEFSALKTEISFIKEKIANIEDKELVIMETTEKKEKIIPEMKVGLKEEEKKFQEFKEQKETAIKKTDSELTVLKKKREELSRVIEPEWASHYEKVLKMRGEKVVVAIVGDQCQGCHQKLKPQLVIDVKISEKVFECDRCNRIVYWQPEEKVEVVVPE